MASVTKTPQHPTPPPLVHVSGTHREMGRQIGEACRKQVQHGIENSRKLVSDAYVQLELTWEGAQIQPANTSRSPRNATNNMWMK